jgi:hypothetical protein
MASLLEFVDILQKRLENFLDSFTDLDSLLLADTLLLQILKTLVKLFQLFEHIRSVHLFTTFLKQTANELYFSIRVITQALLRIEEGR